ncbi:hypothetical protein [Actinophytocola sp.]|uniref:hypothetical protein n=1 Tax=Actinophytocola sp. TaxID=1872138 RepID=UPI002ED68195
MLAGLDDIAWDELGHAYGSAEDVPDMIRAAASDDDEEAGEGVEELYDSVVHQGSTYTATPVALPFLLEIVANPVAHNRAALVGLLGFAADGDHDGTILAVLRQHTEQLLGLLADDDEHVREAAAQALGHLDGVPATRLRWDVEDVPRVRASILMAAHRLDPALAKDWLAPALTEQREVRAAAAYLIGTNGLPWSQAATDALVSACADGNPLENWIWATDWLSALLSAVDSQVALAVVAALSRSGHADVRDELVFAAGEAMSARRSAPAVLVPALAPLLADPDEQVRGSAVTEIARSGAAALVADELAALADAPGQPSTTALCTLIALGDPRWRTPVLAGRSLERVAQAMANARVPMDAELLAAVRARFAAEPTHNERIDLVLLLGSWGPAALPALSDVLAVFDQTDRVAPAALAAISPDDPEVRRILAGAVHNLRAAEVLYELTGDAAPLVDAVAANLSDADAIGLLAGVGDAARPLLPRLIDIVRTDAEIWPAQEARIAAARVVWSLTRDTATVLPAVSAVLRAGGDRPRRAAAEFAADLREHSLEPVLTDLLTNRFVGVAAAVALWRLTGRAESRPAVRALAEGWPDPDDAIAALLEMSATDTVDVLHELAERDERLALHSAGNDYIAEDERLRAKLREAVATLRESVRG